MVARLSRPEFTVLCREADRAGATFVRRYRLPFADREDVHHDLLVDLLTRLKDFDPSRGSLGAFAAIVIRHGVACLAASLSRHRALFAPVSLDDPLSGKEDVTLGDTFGEEDGYLRWMWHGADPITDLERRLTLDRALNTLPPEQISLCADLLGGSVGRLSAERLKSRATLYRQLNDVRLRLLAAGVGVTA